MRQLKRKTMCVACAMVMGLWVVWVLDMVTHIAISGLTYQIHPTHLTRNAEITMLAIMTLVSGVICIGVGIAGLVTMDREL